MPEYIYTGSRTDNRGYGHEGEGGNKTSHVINRLSYIEDADNYFLLIGTNDNYPEIVTVDNISTIIENLLARDTNPTVYLSTLLPRADDSDEDERIIRINQEIRNLVNTHVSTSLKLVELENNFRAIGCWPDLLLDDIHPSLEGYKAMVNIISAEIDQ